MNSYIRRQHIGNDLLVIVTFMVGFDRDSGEILRGSVADTHFFQFFHNPI